MLLENRYAANEEISSLPTKGSFNHPTSFITIGAMTPTLANVRYLPYLVNIEQ